MSALESNSTSAEPLAHVDIDAEGCFKYVLIRAHPVCKSVSGGDDGGEDGGDDSSRSSSQQDDNTNISSLYVRGTVTAEFHADVYDQFTELAAGHRLEPECLGGGRILHEPQSKRLKVYGYSVGFGRADHTLTAKLLQRQYPHYDIVTSDDGY